MASCSSVPLESVPLSVVRDILRKRNPTYRKGAIAARPSVGSVEPSRKHSPVGQSNSFFLSYNDQMRHLRFDESDISCPQDVKHILSSNLTGNLQLPWE